MTILSIISALCGALSFALGFIVVTSGPKSSVNRFFLLFSIAVSYVAFTEYGYRQSESTEMAFYWLKLSQVSPLLYSLMLTFVLTFTRKKNVFAGISSAIFLFGPAILFSIVDIITNKVSGVPVHSSWGWDHNLNHNNWYHLYSLWIISILAVVLYLCIEFYLKNKNKQKKQQSKYMMIAFILISFMIISTQTLFQYINFEFPELSTAGFTLANILIAYAIWRHKLFLLSPSTAAKEIIETMSDALLLVDNNGIIVTINSATQKMLCISGEKLIGSHVNTIITDNNVLQQILGQKEPQSKIFYDFSVAFRNQRCEDVPVSLSVTALRDTDGAANGIILIARDISDRIAIQKALQEANEHLELRVNERTSELEIANANLAFEKDRLLVTLQSIGDGVIVADTLGNIVMINQTAEEISGWTLKEIVNKPVLEVFRIVSKDNRTITMDPVGDAIRSGIKVELPDGAVLITRDGSERVIEDSAAPIKNQKGIVVGIVVVFRDVTEKLHLQQELLKAKRLESIGKLAGGIAHDFNNFLTGMINNLFIVKTVIQQTPEVYHVINETEKTAFKAQQLTSQLLTFSQGGEPILKVGSIQDLISESIGFIVNRSDIEYELDFEDKLMNVLMDKGQIEQVLNNLVVNSLEAMPNGGNLHICCRNVMIDEYSAEFNENQTKAAGLSKGTYVKVTIRDSGYGIPEQEKEKVFDPFFSTKGSGRGLGLAIVYSIIRKHGGAIFIDASVKVGASLSWYLPAIEESTVEQITERKRVQNPDEEQQYGRLLIMDDEEIIRKTTSQILMHIGYTVVTAISGEDALRIFNEAMADDNPFDLAILDLTVDNGMGGKECVKQLKAIDSQLKTIVSSGYSNDDVLANYSKYGFDGMIQKPYIVDELLDQIQNVLYPI